MCVKTTAAVKYDKVIVSVKITTLRKDIYFKIEKERRKRNIHILPSVTHSTFIIHSMKKFKFYHRTISRLLIHLIVYIVALNRKCNSESYTSKLVKIMQFVHVRKILDTEMVTISD